MLIHATKPKTDYKPGRRTRGPQRGRLYTVASCPGDEFPREAQFTGEAVYSGLKDEAWPAGMVFVSPAGVRLVVQGRRLVSA